MLGSILLLFGLMIGRDLSAAEASLGPKINCALQRGTSSFIVRLDALDAQRSVTFVNENPAATGRLSIAVSDRLLTAESPLWSAVDGAIAFRNKRLFALSLVGVEANYVRLTFKVESGSPL